MKKKRYTVNQIALAYLFGRFEAYKDEGLFQEMSFEDFIRLGCEALVSEEAFNGILGEQSPL